MNQDLTLIGFDATPVHESAYRLDISGEERTIELCEADSDCFDGVQTIMMPRLGEHSMYTARQIVAQCLPEIEVLLAAQDPLALDYAERELETALDNLAD